MPSLGSLEIDHEVQFGRPLYRQIVEFRIFDYPVHKVRRATIHLGIIHAVTDQTACCRKLLGAGRGKLLLPARSAISM